MRFRELANLGNRLRERFLQPLDVLEDFRFFAIAEQRLDFVAFLAREFADLRDDDRDHRQLGIDMQRLEVFGRESLAHVGHRRQAKVRLVDAVEPDRLVVAHLRERRREIDADGRERRLQEALDHAEDGLRPRKAHLQIDLRELGLAVGAQVFVAEAAHDLEILVEARDHEDLLEQLRRLRQRIELARIHAAGHQVVARALGRGARHERRLNFVEALRVEILANGDGDFVAQLDVALHLGPAQVNVAILQAHFFVGQHACRPGEKGSGLQSFRMRSSSATTSISPVAMFLFTVFGIAQLDVADDGDDEFRAHRGRAVVNFGAGIGGDDRLG